MKRLALSVLLVGMGVSTVSESVRAQGSPSSVTPAAASAQGQQPDGGAVAAGAWWKESPPAGVAAEGTVTSAAASVNSASRGGESLDMSAIMRSAEFQKQLAESYLSETDVEPRVSVKERETMIKVMEFIAGNQMPQAIELLEKSRGEAVSAVFDFTLANVHFQREEYEPAAAAYAVAVKKFPKFRRAWRNLGLIYMRLNQFDKAIPALTKMVEQGGGDGLAFGLLGFAYASLENQLAAESAYRMAILLDPGTLDWKMGLVRSFYKQERWHDVIALVGKLINDNPQRGDLWLLQANAYIGLNQPMRAAENYEIMDQMGQSTLASLMMLADIYINEGLYGQAVDVYIKAMALDPKVKPERAVRAAKVLTARGALDDTRRLLDYIDQHHAEQFSADERKDVLKLRARLAVAQGAGEEESRLLEEIVKLDPLDGEALILLGQYKLRAGDRDQAIFYFERAAAMEKFEADAKVRHAQLLVREGKYDQALPLLRRAQQVNPRENIQTYLEQIERVARGR